MGQSPSTDGYSTPPNPREGFLSGRFDFRLPPIVAPAEVNDGCELPETLGGNGWDYTADIPDECLACVFGFLAADDRRRCSQVCRRWLCVEGQSRQRLSLNAQSELQPVLPVIFTRFDAVSRLVLRCDRRYVSVGDDALIQIARSCRNLSSIRLRGCRQLTDDGIAAFAEQRKGTLKKLSCGSCAVGPRGVNALLKHCTNLEQLSLKRLRCVYDSSEPFGAGVAPPSLKSLCLKDFTINEQFFEPLITGAKKLRVLKIIRCLGDWDRIFQALGKQNANLAEVHLEKLQMSDIGISAIANCPNLEILHIIKMTQCTNTGLVCVAEHCKLLRKLHIDGFKANRITDEGLMAMAKLGTNLEELVLIGVNATHLSLKEIACNCRRLERLALCGSETIGDEEIVCIAAKCVALRKLCIKGCPISDVGIEALAWGCPNLVKVKVRKCRGVSSEVAQWMRERRVSLALNLDYESEAFDASGSDGGAAEMVELPPDDALSVSSSGRLAYWRNKLGLFAGRNFLASTFRSWYNGEENSSGNS